MEQIYPKATITEGDEKMALRQVAELVEKTISLKAEFSSDMRSFYTKQAEQSGIFSADGKIEDGKIILQLGIFRFSENPRISARTFCNQISKFGPRIRIAESNDDHSLSVILEVKAVPLSFARASELIAEFKNLDSISRSLQAQLPRTITQDDLTKLYEDFRHLAVVYPWKDVDNTIKEWSVETAELLVTSPIAFYAPSIIAEFILGSIANYLLEYGFSIGRLIIPAVRTIELLEIIRKAPGKVCIPATSMSVATSRYEVFNEMQSLLSSMAENGDSAIFTGKDFDDLQRVFVGQGSKNDPLLPIIRHIPKTIPLEYIARFAVYKEASMIGGLSKSDEDIITADICKSIEAYNVEEQWRLIPIVARRAVRLWDKKSKFDNVSFTEKLRTFRETFAGFSSDRHIMERSSEIQDHFLRVLTDPEFMSKLQEEIIGQDQATEQLTRRLQEEILTRPLHQPLRCLFVGTPASGKSASAEFIARQLDIHYVNIDIASMSDLYSGKSSLLGSARGLVGSFEQGILQEAANNHKGSLLEISDLDHAPPNVCAGMADLFLKVMETGEIQSATGNIIPCANLIIIFTVNLPEGKDEAVMKGFGFGNPTQKSINTSIISELKRVLSSAFLSRVGTPIVFKPIDASAYAKIVERAIKVAIINSAERLEMQIGDVIFEPDVGKRITCSMETKVTSFGARALMEKGRSMAATSILELYRSGASIAGHNLVISIDNDLKLNIKLA